MNYAGRQPVPRTYWPWRTLEVGAGWSIPRAVAGAAWKNAGNFRRLAKRYGYRVRITTQRGGMTIERVA